MLLAESRCSRRARRVLRIGDSHCINADCHGDAMERRYLFFRAREGGVCPAGVSMPAQCWTLPTHGVSNRKPLTRRDFSRKQRCAQQVAGAWQASRWHVKADAGQGVCLMVPLVLATVDIRSVCLRLLASPMSFPVAAMSRTSPEVNLQGLQDATAHAKLPPTRQTAQTKHGTGVCSVFDSGLNEPG